MFVIVLCKLFVDGYLFHNQYKCIGALKLRWKIPFVQSKISSLRLMQQKMLIGLKKPEKEEINRFYQRKSYTKTGWKAVRLILTPLFGVDMRYIEMNNLSPCLSFTSPKHHDSTAGNKIPGKSRAIIKMPAKSAGSSQARVAPISHAVAVTLPARRR